MSNKSRQGIRPAFLAAVLGVAAMLAILAALTLPSGPAHAQSSPFGPGAPTAVNAAANSDGTEVTVTWTAASGGAPATGYEVERKVGHRCFRKRRPGPHRRPWPVTPTAACRAAWTYHVPGQGHQQLRLERLGRCQMK